MGPHRWQPTRLPHHWDSPGKNTGMGCHFLLQCMKVKVKVKSLSRVRLLATPRTAAYQAPPSMGFSRQEYWSGVPLPSPKKCSYHMLMYHISKIVPVRGYLWAIKDQTPFSTTTCCSSEEHQSISFPLMVLYIQEMCINSSLKFQFEKLSDCLYLE